MTASILKQDPNTKRQCHANNLPSTEEAVKTKPKQDSFFFFFICHRF